MYDREHMPPLNLREWLWERHLIIVSVRDDNEVWARTDLDDDQVDRLQCEFENAELEQARIHTTRMAREQFHCQHPPTDCDPGCMCSCWMCNEERRTKYWCYPEQGIPDCPGHQHPYQHCPGASGTTQCPEGSSACDDQACPEHPAHQGDEHTYQQHHSPGDHVGEGTCFCHG